MTDTTTTGTTATEAAPADAGSLLHVPASTAAETAATPAEEFSFADKVLAKGADGGTDWEATARNAERARQHLEKRLGAGDAPPKDASGYQWTPPEGSGLELDAERVEGFKSLAHKAGLTPAQYEAVMGAYADSLPSMVETAAKLSATQAREALAQTWTTAEAMDAGIKSAQRAISAMPADLQEATLELGNNPAFARAMAWIGQQLGEDRAPGSTAPPANVDLTALQASEAYRNPRHPEHAQVSTQVRAAFARMPGANMPI